jgi:hypothetical protein
MRANCPACGQPSSRALYCGFPLWLCECGTAWGFWSWVPAFLPFNGVFLVYEPGHYLGALWHFLKGEL